MNAIAYCRTASKPQNGLGTTLKAQEQVCRKFAAKNGYKIDRVFAEQASGASKDRQALKKLLEYARKNKGKLRAIIVHRFDRLSRNFSHLQSFVKALKTMGVELLSVSEKNEMTASTKFVKTIMAAFTDYENDLRSTRIKEGIRQAKLRKGKGKS